MQQLPSSIQQFLISDVLVFVNGGMSGAAVYRCQTVMGRAFLKIQEIPALESDSLLLESQKLNYFAEKQLAPKALYYICEKNYEYLLIESVVGKLLDNLVSQQPAQMISVFALALKTIHQLPIGTCPFSQQLADKLPIIKQRTQYGLINPIEIAEENAGKTIEQLHEEFLELTPQTEDLVVVHGDYTLRNILVNQQAFKVIDVGRSGVGDRYQDIAIALRDIEEYGAEMVKLFLEVYGLKKLDQEKLRFYHLMDEFF